jgi:hypothetical protein
VSGVQVTAEDIAALRQEDGGIQGLIAALTGRVPKPATVAEPAVDTPPDFGPHHRPGAWPAGTRTDQPTCHPDCRCAITSRPAVASAA